MKKRILIICYYYTPNGEIGAVRPSKIAEYLTKDGYEVFVFTKGYSANDGGIPSKIEIPVYRINNETIGDIPKIQSRGKKKLFNASKNKFRYVLKQHYRLFLDLRKDKEFIDAFLKYERNNNLNTYDVVFTTAFPISPLLCGQYMKKKYPHIIWINDFRDPLLDNFTPFLFRGLLKSIQTKSCKICDAIVAVSHGYVNRICKKESFKKKAYMIPNGFDSHDLLNDNHMPQYYDKLIFTYVGSLYEGRRDISPLFDAIMQLIKENRIQIDRIGFQYAGNDFPYLFEQAKKYGMEKILKNFGRVSHEECIKIQQESSMLVLSTWNTKGEEGVFPGKFLEYMLIQKPIIAMVNGGLGNSEVTQVINEGELGIAYEDANPSENIVILKSYIEKQYYFMVNNGEIEYNPKQEVLQRYNYQSIVKQLEEIIDG